MASTRELWLLLRARDEASRVVSSFSRNVRAAALATQAAQKSAEAQAIRQQAQMLKTNGATAQSIRAIDQNVIALEKQARAQTLAAASAREQRAQMLAAIGPEVKAANLRASNLERQARDLSLAAARGEEVRQSIINFTGATNEHTNSMEKNINALRRRASTLNAEAAVERGVSNQMIARVSQESVGLEDSIRSYERRAAAIRAQAQVMRNAAAEQKVSLDTQIRALTNQANALDQEANSLRRASLAAREHDERIRGLTSSLTKVGQISTIAAFALGTIGVGGLIGLKKAIDTAVEYERQVRATMTQVGNFKTSLAELGDVGKRIAGEIGVSFNQIQPALYDVFSSMDVNVKDAENLLRSFSKAAVAGQEDITNVSRATIGILNAFHRPASDVNHILDIQFQLVKLGIGTYAEWTSRIGLVTPSAVRAGQSIEMMAAALEVSTRMGIPAARSATAVSRAMDALSHPKSVKNMEALGIKVRDATGQLRPMNEILRQFRDVLMKMPEKDRVGAILDVFKGSGGTIEARRFLQNILLAKGNLELFDSLLDRTKKGAGSMEEAYKTMADSTATKTQLLSNKWQLLKIAIGEALLPQFNKLLDIIQKLVGWFNTLPNSTKNTIAQFLLWGSIISIILAGLFAFVGISAMFIGAIVAMGTTAAITLGVLTLIPVALVALGAAFFIAYQKSAAFRNVINQLYGVVKSIADVFIQTGQSIKASFDAHILPPLQRLWTTIQNNVIPIVSKFANMFKSEVVPKVEEAGRIIRDLADGAFKKIGEVIDNVVIPAINKMGDWWKKHQDTLKPLMQIYGQLVKWMLIVGAVIIGVLAAAIIGPLVAAVTIAVGIWQAFAMAIVAVIDWVKQLWAWIQQLWGQLQQFGSTIGQMFQNVWNSIVTFFQGLLNWFQQLPGQILGFLQGIPSAIGHIFVTALNQAAYAVGYGLGIIYLFFTQSVPRIIAFLIGLPSRIGEIFSSAWHKAVEWSSKLVTDVQNWWRQLPSRISSAISNLASNISKTFSDAWHKAVEWTSKLVTDVQNWWHQLPGRITKELTALRNSIVGAFSSAGTWLFNAGRDIIQGAINGIQSMAGGAIDIVKGVGHSLVKGFEKAVGVHSPSVIFRDIGFNVIQGLINGITGSRKALQNAMARITHDVMSSLQGGGASNKTQQTWAKYLGNVTKQLLALEAKRASINANIATTQKSINEQLKLRSELATKITDNLSKAADLTTIQSRSPKSITNELSKRLDALKQFQSDLITLKANGLDAQTITDLATQGVDQAGALAKALAKSSPDELKNMATLQEDIRKTAKAVGDKTASGMYDAGIAAAQGLIKGLQSQSAAITKQMESIANALIKAIKKALGIKSPSKVFHEIGTNTALGYSIGFRRKLSDEVNGMQALMTMYPQRIRANSFNSQGGTYDSNSNDSRPPVNVTVYTNEIDPRKTAQDLGWELQGRLK